MLLREIKNIFHKELDGIYGKEEVSSFFYLLIEHYYKLERFVLAVQPNLVLAKQEQALIFEALSELKLEKPVQHILGTAYFMELDFKVNEQVLIPRPETEDLVGWILDDIKAMEGPVSILDIGTGSGCIPIVLAKNNSDVRVKASDISAEALRVAQINAENHQVTIDFFQADIFEWDHGYTYDLIVSNPPYVREMEKASMQTNVLHHEPRIALFVPDGDPLKFYRAIVKFASGHLKAKGALYLEINQYLGNEMMALLRDFGFSSIALRKDIFGNDRMVKGMKS